MGDGYLQSGCLKSKIRKSITYDKISDFFCYTQNDRQVYSSIESSNISLIHL